MPLGLISKTGANPGVRTPRTYSRHEPRTRLSGTSLANVTSGGGQVPAFLVEPIA